MTETRVRRHPDTQHKVRLNPGEDDEVFCYGYRRHLGKTVLTHFLSVALVFVPYLIGRWKPNWRIKWFFSPCSLWTADSILVKDAHGDGATQESVHREMFTREECFPSKYAVPVSADENHDPTTHLLTPDNPSYLHVYFYHKNAKYVWDREKNTFVRLSHLDKDTNLSDFGNVFRGYSAQEEQNLQILYGLNEIDVEVKSYLKLLIDEVLNPFYIFQIGSMILWSLDNYIYYATCILIVSLLSIAISLLETRRQSQALHDMVASSNELQAIVYRRSGELEEDVPSNALVPGDIIAIPSHGCTMPCDALLISGSCIVNESMLTGESVPVTKSALPHTDETNDEPFHIEGHKRHILFAGTSIIQTRFYGNSPVLAVVIRTGFSTAKGELIRSILYPKPMGFKFYKDSIRFIMVLFFIAAIGMGYCLFVYVKRGAPMEMIILRCLDIVTIVVPPALPAAMTVGIYYAQNRLKKNNIFCISPQRINMCGKLKLICFDKTGTLTEEGLDMYGVISCANGNFSEVITDVTSLKVESKLLNCLACCHSLTLIDNSLIGDPLDIKMFEATQWILEEQGEDTQKFDMLMPSVVKPRISAESEFDDPFKALPYEVGIIRQFTFSSAAARMSVITRTLNGTNFEVYVKGAPEKMEELCLPGTIPENFHEQLKELTLQGFRVIGLAHKLLPSEIAWLKVQRMKRHEAEKELTFLGFLIMQNTLKPETTPVIKELLKADIRCVMVTGDNLLTAVSVARDCKMIPTNDRVITVEAYPPTAHLPKRIKFKETDCPRRNGHFLHEDPRGEHEAELGMNNRNYHFVLSGNTWAVIKHHFPHLIPKIIVKGTVFARMGPDQKAQLVEDLQSIDYIVSMCGDGANDVGALKTANVGISLSEAEASVAAPFTSRIANITCVPTVIKEGRCALVTSFGLFKYMALYSIIQFVSVLILYSVGSNLADPQFMYIDLAITTTVAILMGWTSAYPRIVKQRPTGSLVSSPILFSIILQILTVLAFQVGAYLYLTSLPWFEPVNLPEPGSEVYICWETTTIFLVSSYQYLILATVYSKGPPYRQRLYTNFPFLISLVVLTLITVILTTYPGKSISTFFALKYEEDNVHMQYRIALLVLALMNLIMCSMIELVADEGKIVKKITRLCSKKKEAKNMYKRVLAEMGHEGWPPVEQEMPVTVCSSSESNLDDDEENSQSEDEN